MKDRKKVKKYVYFLLMAVFLITLLFLEIFKIRIFGEGEAAQDRYSVVTRIVGGVLCLVLVFYCSYENILKIKLNNLGKSLLFTLPCWLIAINNFPVIPYFSGQAYINPDVRGIALYAFSCLCVGFFEEMAFRGCVFLIILQERRKNTKDIILSILISSAIFGVVHSVNLLAGASPVSVLMQIGYSFLIGGMCSVVLMKTGCIWHCVLIHSVYNFCGGVVPKFGGGEIWTAPEITLTVIVSLAVAAYVLVSLVKLDKSKLDNIYN